MKDNEAVCCVCGKIENKYLMEPFHLGRRTQYMCVKCYRIGSREVLIRKMVNQNRVKKQKEKNR